LNAIHRLKTATAAAALLSLAACATMGTGGGELERKGHSDVPVLFSWQSDDGGISGTMVATLPDATYKGRFFQITQHTQASFIAPLWSGWTVGWYDWPYWGFGAWSPYDGVQFITRYTGKVVANLQTQDGRHMRCRLHMSSPSRGMSGGGEGECQVKGQGTVHARF
jgi:hypothetical protein